MEAEVLRRQEAKLTLAAPSRSVVAQKYTASSKPLLI